MSVKITTGFVVQNFTDDGVRTSSEFIASDSSSYENDLGEPIEVDADPTGKLLYFPFDMVQPAPAAAPKPPKPPESYEPGTPEAKRAQLVETLERAAEAKEKADEAYAEITHKFAVEYSRVMRRLYAASRRKIMATIDDDYPTWKKVPVLVFDRFVEGIKTVYRAEHLELNLWGDYSIYVLSPAGYGDSAAAENINALYELGVHPPTGSELRFIVIAQRNDNGDSSEPCYIPLHWLWAKDDDEAIGVQDIVCNPAGFIQEELRAAEARLKSTVLDVMRSAVDGCAECDGAEFDYSVSPENEIIIRVNIPKIKETK